MMTYCVKCRAKREGKNPVKSATKRGVPMVKSICPVCGTKMCRIGN